MVLLYKTRTSIRAYRRRTFVTQEGSILVPSKLDFTSSLDRNDILTWTNPSSSILKRHPIQSAVSVTAEDVITQSEHPDFRPIQQETVNACRITIQEIVQNVYPSESGQWAIRHIYRQHPYLAVTLSRAHPTSMLSSIGASRFSLTKRRFTGLAWPTIRNSIPCSHPYCTRARGWSARCHLQCITSVPFAHAALYVCRFKRSIRSLWFAWLEPCLLTSNKWCVFIAQSIKWK